MEDQVKNRLAWMFVSVLSFAISSSGCHITTCEHGSVCGLDDEQARDDSCRALCDRLVVCGNVAGSDHDSCMVTCYDEYDRAPAITASGCGCVSRASCSEISDRQCPGAPPIGGGYGSGSTSSTSTAATTGSGSVTVGATVTGTGAGGSLVAASSTSTTYSTATTSSSTSGAGGQPGSGGAPGQDASGSGGAPATDAGHGTCGD
jgi:hypothetical protein